MKNRIKYKPGIHVRVQLNCAASAIGVVARKFRLGFALGYFYVFLTELAPTNASTSSQYEELQTDKADLICVFADNRIVVGAWPVIGLDRDPDAANWPLPVFGSVDLEGRDFGWEMVFNEIDLSFDRQKKVSRLEACQLPEAAIFGCGAVEITLTNIACQKFGISKHSAVASNKAEVHEPAMQPHCIVSPGRRSVPDGLLANSLRALLDALDVISEAHGEIYDTAVRDRLSEAISKRFIEPDPNFRLPRSFAMFTAGGNRAIRPALEAFLNSPEVQKAAQNLKTARERLDAFQDITIKSGLGKTYDEYFGHADSQSSDF